MTTASTVQLDPRSIQALATALKGGGGGGSGTPTASSGGGGSFPSAVTGGLTSLATTALTGLGKGLEGLKNQVISNIDTWRGLSKVGANFSNDVIGMSAAAAEARVSLLDFAGIVERNAKNFAGLGGSVTRGVEAFSKVAKEFQDTDIARRMMQLGYTSAETNELLALQVGFMRNKFGLDKKSQESQFQAIEALNTEMDLLTKITGKTRQEQESALKKVKDDAAIEAKFKLIGITQNAEAEKKARENFAKQYAQAEARGQGEVFKDFFLTGTVRSKEAAMQMAVSGQAGIETAKAATALAKGNVQLADEYNKAASASMVALQKNTAYLDLVTRSGSEIGGAASNVAGNLAKANEPLVDSVNKIIDENTKLGVSQKSYRELLDQIRADTAQSQLGFKKNEKTGQYEDQAKATRAVIDAEKLKLDLTAAAAGALRDTVKPAVDKFADKVSSSIQDLRDSIGTENVRAVVESEVKKGLDSAGAEGGAIGKLAATTKNAADTLSTGLTSLTGTLTDLFTGNKANVNVLSLPKGSTVVVPQAATGAVLKGPVDGYLAELHGEEIVARKDQLQDHIQKTVDKFTGMISNTAGSMPMPKPGNLDLSSINETIKTSFSSVAGGSSTIVKAIDESNKMFAELKPELEKANRLTPGEGPLTAEGTVPRLQDMRDAMKGDDANDSIEEQLAMIPKSKGPVAPESRDVRYVNASSYTGVGDQANIIKSPDSTVSESAAVLRDFYKNSGLFKQPDTAAKQYAQAESRGQGELFKDSFLTGTVRSKEAQEAEAKKAQELQKVQPQPPKTTQPTGKKIPSMSDMVKDLAKASGIKDPNKIRPGQQIKLPDGTSYEVKAGDTLSKIAQQTLKNMQSNVAGPSDKSDNQSKYSTQEAGKVSDADTARENARFNRQAQEAKKAQEAQKPQPQPPKPAQQGTATLDDVVKNLEMLNKTVSQLVYVNETIGKQQVKAIKSSSTNLYERF